MKLNADLGESYGHWQHDADADIMPLIDMANVACGYHAGDALSMKKTTALAKRYGIDIGAHPSYPDLQGFGRRSMRIPREELCAMIHAQIAVLEGMALCEQYRVSYVKPHGALYNDMMQNPEIFSDVCFSLAHYHTQYPLVVQALPDNQQQILIAKKFNIALLFEAFCDRRYEASGLLMSRQKAGAVLSVDESVEQAKLLIKQAKVISSSGEAIDLHVDTLCVHGDTPDALKAVSAIRSFLLAENNEKSDF